MPTIQESVDALVVETTGLTNTVSGRITDMTNKVAAADVAKGAAENAKALKQPKLLRKQLRH